MAMTAAQPESATDWLTLAECAADVKVALEVVRSWCVQFENGEPNGLASSHYGTQLAKDAKRLNRRVHREDWIAFKAMRRQAEKDRAREVRRFVSAPIQFCGKRRQAVAVRNVR